MKRTLAYVVGLRRQPWVLLALALCIYGGFRLADLSVYMLDHTRTEHAEPDSSRVAMKRPFMPVHSCFSGYIVGSLRATHCPEKLYRYPQGPSVPTDAGGDECDAEIDAQLRHKVEKDVYNYPPQFLLLPWSMLRLSSDFFVLRSLWFVLNVSLFTVAAWFAARAVSGGSHPRAMLVWAAVMAAPVTSANLQLGNVHLFILIISILSLVAFDARRHWAGGALLGFAVVGKLFPAAILLYLLVRREWRAAGWTVGWAIVYSLIVPILFGMTPYDAFVREQLGRVLSGSAWQFRWSPIWVIQNMSFPGLAQKLMGLGASKPAAVVVESVLSVTYALFLLGVVVHAARRSNRAGRRLDVRTDIVSWVAIFVLAQARSPFLPWVYGTAAALVLLALIAPVTRPIWHWRSCLCIAAWALLSAYVPLHFGPRTIIWDGSYTAVGTIVAVVVGIVALRATATPADPPGSTAEMAIASKPSPPADA